jgi:hypothetical protein
VILQDAIAAELRQAGSLVSGQAPSPGSRNLVFNGAGIVARRPVFGYHGANHSLANRAIERRKETFNAIWRDSSTNG